MVIKDLDDTLIRSLDYYCSKNDRTRIDVLRIALWHWLYEACRNILIALPVPARRGSGDSYSEDTARIKRQCAPVIGLVVGAAVGLDNAVG